ncbi:hypothetical protein [Paenibacillus lignilyticus]|uniref:Glycosyl hydrolase n=1 Tax=Paenibacillus lignilyticus TaxID=1172615 RepID=A0ABS5CIZ5_9BACL|nr:hypothetical protein [Paenibacillus lignilyticus]MBP3965862.1 hypothetical protein [Paenibacillus lignilyticus]
MNQRPQAGKLANWLLSWVQPSGAIHGFHNHSVWGSNPYRWGDFTSGHSTWSSPLLAALSMLIKEKRDSALENQLFQMIRFQTSSFQEDGQYAHIGFQIGDTAKFGLIHNGITNVSLGLTLKYGESYLSEVIVAEIRSAMERNFEAIDSIYPFGIMYKQGRAISNQEYARIWGKLLHLQAFGGDEDRCEALRKQLDYMIGQFHFRGLPDMESEASYRYDKDKTSTEPGEYYGLLIGPLVLAYELFGDERYLTHAGNLCRHVARSVWCDNKGLLRMHRVWYHSGSQWMKLNEPMLIAGMGMTLYAVDQYIRHVPDPELSEYLAGSDRTYAAYQNPRGFFASATGWNNEADVAPSTAWHTHDLLYLVARNGADDQFWSEFSNKDAGSLTSVLLGNGCMWMERDQQWTITDYFGRDVYQLLGRKDEARFGRDMSWVGGERSLREHFAFSPRPAFMITNKGIYLMPGGFEEDNLQLSSAADIPYLGLWK